MHYRMLVTLAQEPGETSLQVRSRVFNLLMQDPSFCGEAGRFASPLADWFVIGGRWSGCLTEAFLAKEYDLQLKQRFPKLAGEWYREADAKAHAPALDALWAEFGGHGPSPFNRGSYEQHGYDDDAQLLTRELYAALLAEYEGEPHHRDGCHCRFLDLDDEPIDDTFIGRKWLVAVDYHS
jgi:hypothetical protein